MVMMGGMPVALLGAAGARAYAGLQQTLDEGTVGVGRSRQDSRRDVTHICARHAHSDAGAPGRRRRPPRDPRPRTTCTTGDSPGASMAAATSAAPSGTPAAGVQHLSGAGHARTSSRLGGRYEADPRMAWTLNPSFPGTLTAPLFPPSNLGGDPLAGGRPRKPCPGLPWAGSDVRPRPARRWWCARNRAPRKTAPAPVGRTPVSRATRHHGPPWPPRGQCVIGSS